MLAGLGEAQTRAHGRGRLLFRFPFAEQTSNTPADRLAAQQRVCSAEQKAAPQAWSFSTASRWPWGGEEGAWPLTYLHKLLLDQVECGSWC